jgi:hypothetical protein
MHLTIFLQKKAEPEKGPSRVSLHFGFEVFTAATMNSTIAWGCCAVYRRT